MQRILHVIGSLNNGGSQSVVMNLYRNIDRSKLQFDFIIDRPVELFYAEEIKQLGGKIYVLPSFQPEKILTYIRAWKKFFVIHQEYRIIHGHVRSTASIYLEIAKRYGRITIVHSHSTTSGRGMRAVVKNILQYPLRYQVDYLFACSKTAGEWLFGKKACSKSNFMIINNSIEFHKFQFNQKIRFSLRKSLHIEDKFVIGHVGRFHVAKNHLFLLEIFAEIIKLKNDAVLLLIGDGNLRGEIENKINLLGINESVYLMGYRSDTQDILQAMDVFVFPSMWEGLPVSVIEAQVAGLPCCISDSISKEVCITPYIRQLSLSLPPRIWAKWIVNTKGIEREHALDTINDKNYDIKITSAKLSEFYLGLERQMSNE